MGNIPPLRPVRTAEEANTILDVLRQQEVHLLTSIAKIDRIPQHHEVTFFQVNMDPVEGHGDVYRDKRWPVGEVALTHDALMRLWSAAGGNFLDSHPESEELHCISWKAAGRIREIGGGWNVETASRRIDLRQGSPEATGISTGQLEQQRRDIYMLSESKAQNRVIRKLMGIRQKYPQKEVAWPFIIVRPMLIIDMNDPMQKMMYLADSMGATAQLFGNMDVMKYLMSPGTKDGEDLALPAAPPQPAITAGTPPAQQQPPAGWQQTPELAKGEVKLTLEQAVEAFGGLSHQGQIDELERLVKQKNFDMGKLKTAIKDLTNDAPKYWRRTFFTNLMQMPDAQADDSPFKL